MTDADRREGRPVSPQEEQDAEVEATGETVGEAKWSALRELERRYPGLDKGSVRFAVISEGERGLLGVGYAPARVIAKVTGVGAWATQEEEETGSPAARLREFLERVCRALGAGASIAIRENESELVAEVSGHDLGLLIGKRGQTIDAVQFLANAVVWKPGDERKRVVVDAAGYRERRRTSLERLAERAASDAVRSATPVALEPMSAAERKIVHLHLQEREDVVTSSEGMEPNRRVIVSPAGG